MNKEKMITEPSPGSEATAEENINHKPEIFYDDIDSANKRGVDSYVVTPNGRLKMYSPSSGNIVTVSNDMPSDSNAGMYRANTNSVDNKEKTNTMMDNIWNFLKNLLK